jgi:lipocalin
MKLLAAITLLFVAGQSHGVHLRSVSDLDLLKTLGRWYEAYSSIGQKMTFNKDLVCTVATLVYGERKDGKMSVTNDGRIKTPTGKRGTYKGYAYIPDAKYPGRWKAGFSVWPEVDFYVVKVGPVKSGQYQYMIAAARFKAGVWVLVRDPSEFRKSHEKDVLKYLKDELYIMPWNRPHATYQGPDCIYPN